MAWGNLVEGGVSELGSEGLIQSPRYLQVLLLWTSSPSLLCCMSAALRALAEVLA